MLDDAREEIRRSRPVILVELLAGSTRLRAILLELLEDGYRAHLPGADRPTPISADELARVGDRDVLLVPRERDDVS